MWLIKVLCHPGKPIPVTDILKALKYPKAKACYVNTLNNPSNPNNPPKPINFVGDMVTTNEMLEFYIQTLEYIDGDEKMELTPN